LGGPITNRQQKIAYASAYSRDLVGRHPEIAGLVLGASVARGNDLPISDVDLWCFVDEGAGLPIHKHEADGLYIDIEQQPAAQLRDPALRRDPYWCGYFRDALVLYDRDGDVARSQVAARAFLASPAYRQAGLPPLRVAIERNLAGLETAIAANDAVEICRKSIFAAWTLSDYALTARGHAPGGGRGLARLRDVDPDAAAALVAWEGSATVDAATAAQLVAAYRSAADASTFFAQWLARVEWLFAHGYAADALHALWIALGLRVKDTAEAGDAVRGPVRAASRRWLELLGWRGDVREAKRAALVALAAEVCC
jgi:hypothetical protein